MKPRKEDEPTLRTGFKPNAEALYVPQDYTSCENRALYQTVERYNMVNSFLNRIQDSRSREFAEHLLSQLLPYCNENKLSELDKLLFIVDRALKSDEIDQTRDVIADMHRYRPVDDFLARIKDAKEKEFAAYIAPQLLGDSTEESEMLKVIDFIKSKLVGEYEAPVKSDQPDEAAEKSQILEKLEVDNL